MTHKFQNSCANARFNSRVVQFTCFAILTLFGLALLPSLASNPVEGFITCGLVGGILTKSPMCFLKQDNGGESGADDSQFRKTLLDGVEALSKRQQSLEDALAKAVTSEDFEKLQKDYADLLDATRKLQRAQLGGAQLSAKRPGEVSEATARFLGACYLKAAINQDKLDSNRKDFAIGFIKDVFEISAKSALTTSDIPLPTEYSGDVVELVSAFGTARKYGTVFPLGTGTLKLPGLTTDPDFGLIASSGTVTEKSPQIAWVTFNAEKFGGLVRLPSEIEEDSIVAIGQFIARYASRKLAKSEDYNFFMSTGAGSGVNGSVKGLCLSVIDNSKVVQQASTKTKYSDATLANIRLIRSVVDEAALGYSAYYMHPTFEQHLAGLNTAGDKPYIANGINGASLDGFPIRWVNVMPAYSTGANASKVFMLFGDPSYQYLGVRGAIRFDTSREAGFTTDEVLVRALERFTIGLMATGAVSGLETAAS